MASMLVTVLVLGVFIPVVQATTGAANDVRGRVLVDVYLKTTSKPADVDRVRGLLASKVAHVGGSQYVSKAAALRRAAQALPGGVRPARAPTRCRTRSASRRTSPDNALKLRDALAPDGAGRRAHGDRPGDRRRSRTRRTTRRRSSSPRAW